MTSLNEINRRLQEFASANGRHVLALHQAQQECDRAEHALAVAVAKATVTVEAKTVAEREALAFLQCESLHWAAREARAKLAYCKSLVRDRENALSALQSMANLVREEMRLAGVAG